MYFETKGSWFPRFSWRIRGWGLFRGGGREVLVGNKVICIDYVFYERRIEELGRGRGLVMELCRCVH